MSLRRYYLDKAGMLLFCNTVVLCNVRREMLLSVPNHLH